jgi:tetratricopeptide (TPR) repeat protein
VLGVVCTAGRLRAAVIEERLEEAGVLVRELARLGRGDPRAGSSAEAGLAASRYYLAAGDSASALDVLKRGLSAAQEAGVGGAGAVREASLLLGATMLADGRLGEAVEYAGLAEREAQEAGDRLGALRAGSLLASCHFLEGRLTRAEECAGEALALAAAMGQRDEEVFLDFIKARVRFLLGDYEGCSVFLQRCLCLSELYRMTAAEPVLDAWIARSMVYAGSAAAGSSRLERLESTREVLFFQAEAALFDGNPAGAASAVERGLATPTESAFPPPHGGCWRDGFLALEGRCFSLSRSGTYLQRQLAALRGHLLARRGSGSEAMRELGELVRGVRPADNDPSLHLYLFLYADALPEESGDDDKVTVLAKALKGLQERASRIDAPAERSAFLHANRWNRTIMEEARARRLA